MIQKRKLKKEKSAFSLVEMLLLLMIASLITASSMSVITKKHSRIPKKIVHGKYTCYRTNNGKLMEERYIEKRRIYKREVTECKFEPPAKASYFYIQLVGGGGSGGDAGYKGTTRSTVKDSGTKTGFNWTQSIIKSSPFFITLEEWRGYVTGDKVYGCAKSGKGGDGSNAGQSKLSTLGTCTCGTEKTGNITKENCNGMSTETLACSWLAYVDYITVYGGSGGESATCKTSNVPVDIGLKDQEASPPIKGTPDGSPSYNDPKYDNKELNGGNGGNAYIRILKNSSIVTYCNAYGGKGGTFATRTPCSDYEACYTATAGTNGADGYCSGGTCSSSCTPGFHSPNYTWSHEYDTKYLTAGEGGTAGEYLAIFVRSFKNSTIELKPGRGGTAPELGSGNDGNPGEPTTIANGDLTVLGGLGGRGAQPLLVEILPPAADYPSETSDYTTTKVGISDNYIGLKSSYEKAANMTNMNEIPIVDADGIDLNTFGRGGNGGRSQDNCWIGPHIRKFKDNTLSSSYLGPLPCSDNDYTNLAAEPGAPGSIVIIW